MFNRQVYYLIFFSSLELQKKNYIKVLYFNYFKINCNLLKLALKLNLNIM